MAKRKQSSSSEAKTSEVLSEQQVYDVLQFAENAYRNMFGGMYTPELINARLKDITMMPQIATSEKIQSALSNPKENEQNLIGYSEYTELTSMLYKRILGYFANIMAFDMNYVPVNIKDDKELSSKAYERDLAIVQDFFDKFNHKKEFRTAMKQMMRNEVFYGVLRDDTGGERYVIQELPQTYAKLTGRYSHGLLFDFNMYWFMQPTVSLDMYPKVFKKLMDKAFVDAQILRYNPAVDIDHRTGNWIYWVQTRPEDGFVAFKLFQEIATIVPYLAPLLPDMVLQPVIRALQTDSYIAEASKIIFGQVEFLKDTSAKVKDALSLDPVTLGKFLALMKAGLPSAIKVAAAPLADTKGIEFKGNNEMYNSFLQTSAAVSGTNSRLLYSFDRQNILETKLSLDIDQNVLRLVYAQFEDFLSYQINKRTKKYKFKFILEGFETSTDREERKKSVGELVEMGIVIDQKIASAYGMSVFDLRRQMAESKANKFVDALTPILKANQMSGKEGTAGRPAKPDSELGDEGGNTRSSGTNLEKGEE